MRLDLFTVLELAGRFQDDIHTQFTPGNFGRLIIAGEFDAAAAHFHGIAVYRDVFIKGAVDGIVFQQMCIGIDAGTGIDSDHFHFRILDGNAQCTATNPTKTVNTNLYHL